MNKRWDTPETAVATYRVAKNGDDADGQDCVAGIDINEKGIVRLDLRNLRPIRVLDCDNLVIEIYLADILTALADRVAAVTSE